MHPNAKEQVEEKLGEPVAVAAELRQGKAPSMLAMVTGAALIEVIRRRSKVLPRRFVLAATETQVFAFRASANSREDGSDYKVKVKDDRFGPWPKSEVTFTEIPEDDPTKGATLNVGGDSFPVSSPRVRRHDPDIEALYRLLGASVPASTPAST